MARALLDIEQDILEVNQKERAEFLRILIDDLDAPADANSEAAWLKESERRLDELENGTARTFSADEVIRDARPLLK